MRQRVNHGGDKGGRHPMKQVKRKGVEPAQSIKKNK